MNFNFKEIATAGMVLFAVIDILGSIPIILSLRSKVGHVQSEKASIVAISIMIAFLFVGESILSLIGIDVNSFAVAGAFIIFFLAIEMILGISLLSLRAEYHVENIIVAIIINVIFVYIVLKSSARIERILGKNGLNIIRKVFGVILMAIAVKLFVTNVNGLLSHGA